MNITDLVQKAHINAWEHGFWEDEKRIDDILNFLIDNDFFDSVDDVTNVVKMFDDFLLMSRTALIMSELGEAVEALRHRDQENYAEELADVVIRIGDASGGLGIDLEKAIKEKMAINSGREYKHGKEF